MSPIGNPQNLLIAINGDFANPFLTFVQYLFVPTVLNLFLAYLLLRVFYKGQFQDCQPLNQVQQPVEDSRFALISETSLILLITLMVVKIAMVLMGNGASFRLTYVAIISALPILIFSAEVVRNIDWQTLAFFVAMFLLMASVWRSGVFQSLIGGSNTDVSAVPLILTLSVILSQLVSNVPFVALCLPLLPEASVKGMMALAAGSTIAGNLFILGEASSVIIIQNAEKENETLTFFDFARVGVPLTILDMMVYMIFL